MKALPLTNAALQIREQALGGTHAEVAASLNTIEKMRRQRGELAEATTLFERAVNIVEQSVGSMHPVVAANLLDLGEVRWQMGDLTARVLAFATHGLLAGELEGLTQPALVLTPPTIPSDEDDGLLSMEDILQLKLTNTGWVILSACNTAGGDGSGEGLSGLARAFFFSGAKSLLVSQWSVDDGATQFLMTEIFKRYGKNRSLPPAQALRQGMQAAMTEAVQHPDRAYFAHPFAWAAFFLVGEGGE